MGNALEAAESGDRGNATGTVASAMDGSGGSAVKEASGKACAEPCPTASATQPTGTDLKTDSTDEIPNPYDGSSGAVSAAGAGCEQSGSSAAANGASLCEAGDDDDDAVPDELHVELPEVPERGVLMTSESAARASKEHRVLVRRRRRHGLRWGYVTVRNYKRHIGGSGVPPSGGWPLGLESTVLALSDMAVPPKPDHSSPSLGSAASASPRLRGLGGAHASPKLSPRLAAGPSAASQLSSAVDEAELVRLFGERGSRSPYLRPTPGGVARSAGCAGGDDPPELSLDGAAGAGDSESPAIRIRAHHGGDADSDDECGSTTAHEGGRSQARGSRGAFVPGHRLPSEGYNPGSKSSGMRPRSDSHDHAPSPVAGRDSRGQASGGSEADAAATSASEKRKRRRQRKGQQKAVAVAVEVAEAEMEALTADPFPTPQPPPLESLLPGELLVGTVDQFEKRKHAELAGRDASLPPHMRSKAPFETRQWSHKKRDNPLFDRVKESQRRIILTRAVKGVEGGVAELSRQSREHELELAELRTHRDATGCRCVPAAHNLKKMPAKRLRQELHDRGQSTEGTRAELAARFREATASEPLCGVLEGPAACPCAAAGVACNYDVCQCGCDACSNPLGYESYSRKAVQAHVKARIREANRHGTGALHQSDDEEAHGAGGGEVRDEAGGGEVRDEAGGGVADAAAVSADGEASCQSPGKRGKKRRNRSKSMCG